MSDVASSPGVTRGLRSGGFDRTDDTRLTRQVPPDDRAEAEHTRAPTATVDPPFHRTKLHIKKCNP